MGSTFLVMCVTVYLSFLSKWYSHKVGLARQKKELLKKCAEKVTLKLMYYFVTV